MILTLLLFCHFCLFAQFDETTLRIITFFSCRFQLLPAIQIQFPLESNEVCLRYQEHFRVDFFRLAPKRRGHKEPFLFIFPIHSYCPFTIMAYAKNTSLILPEFFKFGFEALHYLLFLLLVVSAQFCPQILLCIFVHRQARITRPKLTVTTSSTN